MYKLNYTQFRQAQTLAYLAMLDHNQKEYTTKKDNKTFYTYKQSLALLMKLTTQKILDLINKNLKQINKQQQENKLNNAYGKETIHQSEKTTEELEQQKQKQNKQKEYVSIRYNK